MDCSLDLLMPKLPKAELASDSQSLTRTVTLPFPGLPFLGGDRNPSLATRLFEKTRSRRIDGITATLDGGTESPEGSFDLERHVSFWLNGKEVPDFTQLRWPIADEKGRMARTLQPGDQLNVEMKLHDLDTGKYAFPLRFVGVNTAAATPKLDVTVNVRHHWLWAVIAVVIALVVSFVISTGIVNWRERIRIRRHVQQMREESFAEHADLPSVVFLHAVLAQTDKITARRWFLPPPPSATEYLARADRVITILRRYSSLRNALNEAACLSSVKLHYREAIAEVMHRIGPQPLDQKTTDGIVEDLGAIAARLDHPDAWYWSHLKSEASLLTQQARDVKAALGKPDLVEELLGTLENPPADPDKNRDETRKFDRTYWFVKLLYSRHAFPKDVAALIDAYKPDESLEETVFKVGDELAWERLSKAANHNQIEVKLVDSVDSNFLGLVSFDNCFNMLKINC